MEARLLSAGIFDIRAAARLLNMPQAKLRHWVANPDTESMIERDIPTMNRSITLSFVNLIEAHFINVFSKFGVNLNSLRVMAEEAKTVLATHHPFATDAIFKTDGRNVFLSVLQETGDPKLYNLRARNWAMQKVLEREFKEDIVYGPSGTASIWYPRKGGAPNVVVNPKVSFGRPSLREYGVPTETLVDAVDVSDGDIDSVSRWYDIPVPMVKEAVRFEKELLTLH
jgi:uncharacterized protein (DUF433 family)